MATLACLKPATAETPQVADAARTIRCRICQARPSVPCQRNPRGDHLARIVDSYRAGVLSHDALATLFASIEVVTERRMVLEAQNGAAR